MQNDFVDETSEGDIAYPLSELSRSRLRRGSILSFLGAVLSAVAVVTTQNYWIYAGFVLFLGLFVYRRALLIRADPHVILSDSALELRGLTRRRIALSRIAAVGIGSDAYLILSLRGDTGDAPEMIRLARWHFDDDGQDLLARLRSRCGLEDDD